MRLASLIILLLNVSCLAWGSRQYSASGMVLKVDPIHKTMMVSCQSIPGFMGPMTMPFTVLDAKEIAGLTPGTIVEFTLVVDRNVSFAKHVRVKLYQSAEQDPFTAQRLELLEQVTSANKVQAKTVKVGEVVPDFTLIDTTRHPISLSQFSGKVVALNFIYTSCALPNFCYRITNNFGVLQRRFRQQLGHDLVLITVTFDPQRDQPEILAQYGRTWKADPATWHFLTGLISDVRRVTGMFGMDFFPDEGLMNHSLHTAVIDRKRTLVANIEGNQYSAEQLGDLVQSVLTTPRVSGADEKTCNRHRCRGIAGTTPVFSSTSPP
jgi:protein SCO1/2